MSTQKRSRQNVNLEARRETLDLVELTADHRATIDAIIAAEQEAVAMFSLAKDAIQRSRQRQGAWWKSIGTALGFDAKDVYDYIPQLGAIKRRPSVEEKPAP